MALSWCMLLVGAVLVLDMVAGTVRAAGLLRETQAVCCVDEILGLAYETRDEWLLCSFGRLKEIFHGHLDWQNCCLDPSSLVSSLPDLKRKRILKFFCLLCKIGFCTGMVTDSKYPTRWAHEKNSFHDCCFFLLVSEYWMQNRYELQEWKVFSLQFRIHVKVTWI